MGREQLHSIGPAPRWRKLCGRKSFLKYGTGVSVCCGTGVCDLVYGCVRVRRQGRIVYLAIHWGGGGEYVSGPQRVLNGSLGLTDAGLQSL